LKTNYGVKWARDFLFLADFLISACSQPDPQAAKLQRFYAEKGEEMTPTSTRLSNAIRSKGQPRLRAAADKENRLKIAEKEKVISDLKTKLEEAQRRAAQGSQQAQGEVIELDFEQQLRQAFPVDQISEISKGVRGARAISGACSGVRRGVSSAIFSGA
jgi:hypothetical protein